MLSQKNFAMIGPTATGKTDLALKIAEFLDVEIISLDSALIYQDMDIGTAKPKQKELHLVPHHLINIITPLASYSAADFVRDCTKLISEINQKGKIALIVGGTMMYYNVMMHGLNDLPPSNNQIRTMLRQKKETLGIEALYQDLCSIDPVIAKKLKKTDSQRIERALEVFYITQQPMSQFFNKSSERYQNSIQIPTICLIPNDRMELKQKIATRFLQMIDDGFIEEVIYLKEKYPKLNLNYPSMRCVGYRQIWEYLEGKYSKDKMIEKGIIATRQLAKRQLTWLRKLEPEIIINPYQSIENNLKLIKQFIQNNYESKRIDHDQNITGKTTTLQKCN